MCLEGPIGFLPNVTLGVPISKAAADVRAAVGGCTCKHDLFAQVA